MADNTKTFIVLGIAGVGLWYLYEQGYLASIFGSAFGPSSTPQLPPASTPPNLNTPIIQPAPIQSVAPPVQTAPPVQAAPPTATFQIVGTVTNLGPQFSNALKANVSVNGSVKNISIIPTTGLAYDTGGHDITTSLIAQGVNISALLAALQAALPGGSSPSAGTAGIGMFTTTRIPRNLVHTPDFGYRFLRERN